MAAVFQGFRITGGKTASGKLRKLNEATLANLRNAADARAKLFVERMREELLAEYQSQWAKGAVAKSLKYTATIKGNGVDVKFFFGNLRELQYITAMGGGHFQNFPVTPFIITPSTRKALKIPFPNSFARQFIRDKASGQFRGAKSTRGPDGEFTSGILVRKVLWGNKTGGFRRDVISEVAEDEGARFIQDMHDAVSQAIVTVTTGE